jgi:flagellar hook protein FlgE
MSFETGLSGLNASSRNLDVIGNNIANANTTGMKSSRTEFSDLVASSIGSGNGTGAGIGVYAAVVAQQFTQGNITTTGNSLDVAINGNGFFQLTQPDGTKAYTRDGSFKLDKDGNIVTNNGANLMGYPTDKSGNPTNAIPQKLQLPTSAPIAANATTNVTAEFNLDARIQDNAALTTAGKTTNPRSTFGTSLNVYDSQGVASPVKLYFVKTEGTANSWDVYTGIDDATTTYPNLGPLTFDSSGKLLTGSPITLTGGSTIPSLNPNDAVSAGGTGFVPQDINLDLSTVTQYGTAFAVTNLTQDGYTSGELTGLSVGDDGAITAKYSNGQSQSAGQITLADFRNVQGLTSIGNNAWAATYASGDPVQGSPSTGKFGALKSGALEDSNVDLTSELVNMMTAQRAYQANAQTIKTQDQVMSTLVNLR